MKRLALVLCLAACGGTSQAPSASPTPATAPAESANEESINEAAQAEIERALLRYGAFSELQITCDDQAPVLEDFVRCFSEAVDVLLHAAQETASAFQLVTRHDEGSRAAAASFAGEARTYALVTRMINEVEVPFILPDSVIQALQGQVLDEHTRNELHGQVVSTMRQVFETTSAPSTCLAIVSDVRLIRLAQFHPVDSAYSQESAARLRPLSERQINACVEEARSTDATLSAYVPGELNLHK